MGWTGSPQVFPLLRAGRVSDVQPPLSQAADEEAVEEKAKKSSEEEERRAEKKEEPDKEAKKVRGEGSLSLCLPSG